MSRDVEIFDASLSDYVDELRTRVDAMAAAGGRRCREINQALIKAYPLFGRDWDFFFGREHEQNIITSNLLAERLTLLYGASGVGKSSVLRAASSTISNFSPPETHRIDLKDQSTLSWFSMTA